VTDATSVPALVFDVDETDFPTAVLERSREVPVVVDFWAAWCGPCRTLGPMLEEAVTARGGELLLAKVDVDRNQALAQAFRVQGIPQVLGFRDGRVVSQFTGVVPAPRLAAFLDELAPSEADRAVTRARALDGDAREDELRRALALDPTHREAAIALADLLVQRDPDAALGLVGPLRPDPAAERIVTRAELARGGGGDLVELRARAARDDADGDALLDLGRALAARGEYADAIEQLLAAVQLGGATRDPAREQLVALFGVLGDADERVRQARPRLARALF
jgi:putative thioredoxin